MPPAKQVPPQGQGRGQGYFPGPQWKVAGQGAGPAGHRGGPRRSTSPGGYGDPVDQGKQGPHQPQDRPIAPTSSGGFRQAGVRQPDFRPPQGMIRPRPDGRPMRSGY
jgi:hypothetical protein